MSNLLDIGRIAGVYGIQGWVKIASQTEPLDNIFNYQPWWLKTKHGVKPQEVLEWRAHGKGFVARLEGIDDRTQAEHLGTVTIAIDKADLPALPEGEFYWYELQGCRVRSCYEGAEIDLGTVSKVMPTGANDVLVVKADKQSCDDRERLIPYVPELYIRSIDIESQLIEVDWDPDF